MHFSRYSLSAALLVLAPIAASAEALPHFRLGLGGSLDLAATSGFARAEDHRIPLASGAPASNPRLVTSAFPGAGFASVQVPIWIGDLRIEPELGYLRYEAEATTTFDSDAARETETDRLLGRAIRVGTTVAWSWELAERTRFYAGPRFGVIFRTLEGERPRYSPTRAQETTTISVTDLWVGVGAGAEAFLTPAFSLGVELQGNYVDFGQPEREVELDPEPDPAPPPEQNDRHVEYDDTSFTTHVLFVGRFYFL